MLNQHFVGVRLKVARAFELLRALEADCDSWSAATPLSFSHEQDESGWHVWSAEPAAAPPPILGVQLAEIAYHLRSALDQAATALVLSNGAEPTRRTYFPVALTEQTWKSQGLEYLAGASEDSISAVKAWQPVFRMPDLPQGDLLAMLNEICLVDKHRQLLPVAGGLGLRSIGCNAVSATSALRRLTTQVRDDDIVLLTEKQWALKVLIARDETPDVPDPAMPTPELDARGSVATVLFRTHFPYEVQFGVPVLANICRHARRILLDVERTAPRP